MGAIRAFTYSLCVRFSKSQTRIVPSELPLKSVSPSGENVNSLIPLACPMSASRIGLYVFAYNNRMEPLPLPVTSIFPSGENANAVMPLVGLVKIGVARRLRHPMHKFFRFYAH